MKITPVVAPATVSPGSTSPAQADARARAIAALAGQPVPNANQVSPEEMGALGIKSRPAPTQSVVEDTNEASADAPSDGEPAKADPLSAKYATLARKERALRNQINEFKAMEAKFKEAQEAAKSAPATPSFDASKYVDRERLKASPLDVLIEEGMTYDSLTEEILSRTSQAPTDPAVKRQLDRLEAEVKAAKDEAKRVADEAKNAQTQSYQQAVAQIKTEVKNLVADGDDYEMIRATESVSDVVELIEETFKTEGYLMTIEDASRAVEDFLVEEAMKITKVKKLQQKMAGNGTVSPSGQATQKQPNSNVQSQSPKPTLTQATGGSRPMSARERAILAMEGRLK